MVFLLEHVNDFLLFLYQLQTLQDSQSKEVS